jgi:hypothetical protein
MLAEVLATCRRHERQIVGLRADLARGRGPLDAPTQRVLVALADTVGDGVFVSAEAYRDAFVRGGELQGALVVAGVQSPKQLGRRLQRCEGTIVGDKQLRRLGHDRLGAIWGFVQRV